MTGHKFLLVRPLVIDSPTAGILTSVLMDGESSYEPKATDYTLKA